MAVFGWICAIVFGAWLLAFGGAKAGLENIPVITMGKQVVAKPPAPVTTAPAPVTPVSEKKATAKEPAPESRMSSTQAKKASHLPPGSWNGKTSPSGRAMAPRVKHGLSPSEKPCGPDKVRFKNGCAVVVESTYFNEDGILTTVQGMPRNKKGQVAHFTKTMQFAWRNCKNLEVRLEPARKGIDADFHFLCPDEL